jgi:serine protease inhibitor
MAGSWAAPPDDEIDFILDRPFFFVITRSNLPLFAGVVNEP